MHDVPAGVPQGPRGGAHRRARVKPGKATPVVSPLWKTRMCEFWKANKCQKGEACSYAHGEADLRPSPDFERTSVCPAFLHHGRCDKPHCRYAHSVEELRVAPNLLKSKMCSFYLSGRCVVGKACRFAHGAEELEEATAVLSKAAPQVAPLVAAHPLEAGPQPLGLAAPALLVPLLEVQEVREEASPEGPSPPRQVMPEADLSTAESDLMTWPYDETLKPMEPMKVVVAAAWADDLNDLKETGEALSSLKESKGPGRPRPEKRSRAHRVLVDTLADLEQFPTAVISSVAVDTQKESEGHCVVVNTSPGLLDLGSRHREAVIVLDIEDAIDVSGPLAGCEKLESHLVQIHRRSRHREEGRRSRSCAARRTPGSPRAFRAHGEGHSRRGGARQCCEEVSVPESWCRSHDARNPPSQACVICQRACAKPDPLKPCAACNCGYRVIQQNTFLTVEEEDEGSDAEIPIRRTQSL